MADERRTDLRAGAGDEIDDARGNASLFENLDKVIGGERRVLRGFDDYGVAADERGHHFPGRDGDGEIPGSDESADTDGRAHGHGELVGEFGGSGLAEEAAAFAGHEVGHVDGFLNVAASFGEDFAHFAGHVAGNVFFALDQDFGSAEKNFGAFGRGSEAPGIEGFFGGFDGAIDVFFS